MPGAGQALHRQRCCAFSSAQSRPVPLRSQHSNGRSRDRQAFSGMTAHAQVPTQQPAGPGSGHQSWDHATLRELYPEASAPYASGRLKVSDVHTIPYWQYGNPHGIPVVMLHGGPGASTYAKHPRFCDPALYRIICFDQRGCGQSMPLGCLLENTTPHLVGDMEKLRMHLGIERWQVMGGSWGVALALAYAIGHTDRVLGIILRGVCLMRREEIDWVFRGHCRRVFPAAWDAFVAGLSEAEAQDPLRAYYARLTAPDKAVQSSAAKRCFRLQASLNLHGIDALQVWDGHKWGAVSPQSSHLASGALPLRYRAEQNTSALEPYDGPPHLHYEGFPVGNTGGAEMAQQLLTLHYSMHDGFMPEGGLLAHVHKLRHIPAIAVQGREDMVCPVATMWDLHKAWPELEAQVVPGGGHSMYDVRIRDRLLQAQQRMHGLLTQQAATR